MLNGTELIHEWRELQALTSFQLILEWLSLRSTNSLFSFKQSGDESFYLEELLKILKLIPIFHFLVYLTNLESLTHFDTLLFSLQR